MNFYQTYGLTLASELALPELQTCTPRDSSDVTIRLSASLDPATVPQMTQCGPYLWIGATQFYLRIPQVADYLVDTGRDIWIAPAPGADEDSIRVFLLGSVFGALLLQRGLLVMHGNAVQIGDRVVLCVGQSGAGKSTLAAGFYQRGYAVLADDVVPIDSSGRAIPGFSRIKLWQDVATQLGIDTSVLSRIRPGLEKFNLPVPPLAKAEAVPVRWVYVLESHHGEGISIEQVRGMQRLQPLTENSYRYHYVTAMGLQGAHLQALGPLAGQVYMARVLRPRGRFCLDDLLDRLEADMEAAG